MFKTKGHVHTNFKIRNKKGMYLDISLDGTIDFFPDGSFKQTNCVFQDITEQKKTGQELKEKSSFIDKIIDSSAVSTWISDENGTTQRINNACLKLFGTTEEEVIGKYNLFKDDVLKQKGFSKDIKDVFEKGKVANIIIDYSLEDVKHVKVKNPTRKIINSIITPVLDLNGKVTNAIVQAIDLTEIKQAEQEIRNRETRHNTILQTALDGFWLASLKGEILDANYAYEKMSGYTKDELLTMKISDLEAYESISMLKDHIQLITKHGQRQV